MPARSSCLTTLPALVTARGTLATLRLNRPSLRLWRQPRAPGNLDEAATMTVTGPTLAPLVRVLIGFVLFRVRASPRESPP
jgi:hypothetical protein